MYYYLGVHTGCLQFLNVGCSAGMCGRVLGVILLMGHFASEAVYEADATSDVTHRRRAAVLAGVLSLDTVLDDARTTLMMLVWNDVRS